MPAPHVLEAAHAGNRGRCYTNAKRRKMSDAHKRLGTRPPHGRVGRATENELVHPLAPGEVARRTGRSLSSIWNRRRTLRLPDGRRSNGRVPRLGPWTAEEDTLVRSLPAREAAARTGRSKFFF